LFGLALGGGIPSDGLALHLGCRSIFVERVNNQIEMRRSFEILETDRVLIAEDIVTTGVSFRGTVACLNALPGKFVGGSCIIDRSGGEADVGCELVSLAAIKFPDYAADDLPPELAAIEAYKPGSRGLK